MFAADPKQHPDSAPQRDAPGNEKAYVDAAGSVHVLENGTYVAVAKEKGQVGSSLLKVAEDKKTVGWTAEYVNCCTSYNIPLLLVIYRDGRVRQRLGDGLMIYDWRFWDGSRKVAFCSGTVHGEWPGHCELHDAKSGRLLSVINGRLTDHSPAWVRGLQ
jgi:hypothetical protein